MTDISHTGLGPHETVGVTQRRCTVRTQGGVHQTMDEVERRRDAHTAAVLSAAVLKSLLWHKP